MSKKEKILVSGTAGFIGFHMVNRLLKEGYEVVGLDNINEYYDVKLKFARLNETGINQESKPIYSILTSDELSVMSGKLSSETKNSNLQAITQNPELLHPSVLKERKKSSIFKYGQLYQSGKHPSYQFVRATLEDKDLIMALFKKEKFDRVIHLAAQAGVRYSLENPWTYLDCNIYGTLSILEAIRQQPVAHLVYASSSSVYGLNTKMPLSTSDNVDHPMALYAASKKSNELMAHAYSHLYDIPTTGLRFFTVYGPWGRPDMALFIFTKKILKGEAIDVYNYGDMLRDFTYVDDIVEGVYRAMLNVPEPQKSYELSVMSGKLSSETKNSNLQAITQNPELKTGLDPSSSPHAPYRIFNIGNSSPVKLLEFIEAIEEVTGKKAQKNMMAIQPGDVPATFSDVTKLMNITGYKPGTRIIDGVEKFVEWYKVFYE